MRIKLSRLAIELDLSLNDIGTLFSGWVLIKVGR